MENTDTDQAELFGKFKIFLSGKQALLSALKEIFSKNKSARILTFNPEMLLCAESNHIFRKDLENADFIVPESAGLVLLLKRFINIKVEKLPGIELAWELLKEATKNENSIALVGADEETIKKAIINIEENLFKEIGKKPKILFSRNGFFSSEQEINKLLDDLMNIKPDLLLLGMPFVKQENILSRLREKNITNVMIGVGGSFDVWSGTIERAPVFVRKISMEWLWRLLLQPSRFKRIATMLCGFARVCFFGFKAKTS